MPGRVRSRPSAASPWTCLFRGSCSDRPSQFAVAAKVKHRCRIPASTALPAAIGRPGHRSSLIRQWHWTHACVSRLIVSHPHVCERRSVSVRPCEQHIVARRIALSRRGSRPFIDRWLPVGVFWPAPLTVAFRRIENRMLRRRRRDTSAGRYAHEHKRALRELNISSKRALSVGGPVARIPGDHDRGPGVRGNGENATRHGEGMNRCPRRPVPERTSASSS